MMKLLWLFLNSSSADDLVHGSKRLHGMIDKPIRWVQGVASVLLIAPNLYHDQYILIPFILLSYAAVFIAMIFWSPFAAFSQAASKLDAHELRGTRKTNSKAYETVPLKSNTEFLEHKSLLRILTIHPGDPEQPLVCSLSVEDIYRDDLPPYEALSYVWGPPSLKHLIQVNGEAFRVSSSLFQALIHLRYASQPRRLWVDAICINQADLSERSAQVLSMRHVYSIASRVIVWLGEAECLGVPEVFTMARRQGEESNSTGQVIHYGALRVASYILRNPWWTRAWVVQEFLAAGEVQFQCGKEILSQKSLEIFIERSLHHPLLPLNGIRIDDYRALTTHDNNRKHDQLSSQLMVNQAAPVRKHYTAHRRSLDLLSLVYDFRRRHSTDARDKVFAFQGLANIEPDTSLSDALLIQPDYARPLEELSIELAKSHIRYSSSLSIVSLSECARQTTPSQPSSVNDDRQRYIPSWCPAFMNWDVVKAGLSWQPIWTGLPESQEGEFAAAGGLSFQDLPENLHPIFGEDCDIDQRHHLRIHMLPKLRSTILKVGTASTVSVNDLLTTTQRVITGQSGLLLPSLDAWIDWESVLPQWLDLAKEAQSIRQARRRDNTDIGANFHLTLTVGKFSSPDQRLAEDTASYSSSRGIGNAESMTRTYKEARASTCINRRLFVTDGGQIGLGPTGVEPGDEVCVLLGSQVPMILRKASSDRAGLVPGSDASWLYVGQTYVEDLMVYPGDLCKDIQDGRVEVEARWLI
jgi:hypothetical protein